MSTFMEAIVTILLAVAQSPVSGAHLAPVLAYPGSDLTGGFGFGTLA